MYKNYQKNISGNIAIMFALSLMALMIGVGVAVDLTSMTSKKSSFQNMADAAVLAAAKSNEKEQSQLQLIANNVVNSNNLAGDTLVTTVTLTESGFVQVTINGTYDTVLMGMFGTDSRSVSVVSESPLPSSEPVNIVMVLDTTGSMSFNNKIESLKTAATDLITTLESYESDSLQVGIIPFSQYINIGLGRRNEVWVEYTTDYGVALPDKCEFPIIGTTNCRMEPYPATPPSGPIPPGTCYNDGVPYSCGGSSGSPGSPAGTKEVCDNVYGPLQVCTPQNETHVWKGCVGSRLDPWYNRHEYSGKKVPGIIDISCGTEILALTNNLADVKTKINALIATGATYIPSGLIWGWRALEPLEPLTEANGPYASKTKKVMILMTDGVNTLAKNGIFHEYYDDDDDDDDDDDENNTNYIDPNVITKDLCQKINAANIEVYSIAYEVTDTQTKNMLRDCATKTTMYFDANNAAALQAAFKEIGENLFKLRLTH